MYMLYFDGEYWDKYHAALEASNWYSFNMFRPSEGFWLVPGTDPDDPFYE